MTPLLPALNIESLGFERNNAEVYTAYRQGIFVLRGQWSVHVYLAIVRGGVEALQEERRYGPHVSEEALDALRAAVAEALDLFAGKRTQEYFSLIDVWTEFLCLHDHMVEAIPLMEQAMETGLEAFVAMQGEMALRLCKAYVRTGNDPAARKLALYYAERPYLLPKQKTRREITSLSLSLLASDGGTAGYYERYLRIYGGRRAVFFYRGRRRMLKSRNLSWNVKLISILDSAAWNMSRLRKGQWLAVPFKAALKALRLRNRLRTDKIAELPPSLANTPPPAGPKPVLVTRAMGGLGDILMMTPGLAALHAKFPDREIHFAIPKGFHQLFIGNTDVLVKDIRQEALPGEAYSHWYDLTDCPAAIVESFTRPDVQKSRIEIFASAMGISRKKLFAHGVRPKYHVTAQEKEWAKDWLASAGAEKYIGVQPFSAENYKDYKYMPELVRELSKHGHVLLFHNTPLTEFSMPGVTLIDAFPLRQSIALLSVCAALVGPDSSFLHIAAALDVPSLALSGPVSGRVQTRLHDRGNYIDASQEFKCVPCWRNEGNVCAITGKRSSLCMEILAVEDIMTKFLPVYCNAGRDQAACGHETKGHA